MIHIIRGTTPILIFELPVAKEIIDKCEISFQQANTVLTIDAIDFSKFGENNCKAQLQLTQQQTLNFKAGYNGKAQVRLVDKNSNRWATKLEDEDAKFTVGDIIRDGEL